jgi:flagellar basal-body rod modification protein FlgD
MAISQSQINLDNYMGYTTQVKEPSQNIDKDGFLKLLVAQLQCQDPTSESTQDPAAMVQQMTSFSQLEQLQTVNALLQATQEQNVALFQAQSTGLVGKTARIQGAPVIFKDGEDIASVGIDLAANATQVTMRVRDQEGTLIGTVDLGGLKKGHNDLKWDGTLSEVSPGAKDGYFDQDGVYHVSGNGAYTIEFLAYDGDGKQITATAVNDLRIDSVAFAEGTVLIVAGGKYYSLGDIIEVRV